MHSLVAVALATLVVLYGAVAVALFVQERWAIEIPQAVDPERIQNPEVAIAIAQSRFEENRFREDELALVERALRQAPSFYEPSFLLAAFHASRLSEPSEVRTAYEAALARYPANGRLRLSYGVWLLDSRASLSGWQDPREPGGLRDPLPDAELHLKAAMALEPELAWSAFRALSQNHVPPDRWGALVPDHPLARTHFLDALFQAGDLDSVWSSLAEDLLSSQDPNVLRRIIHWGLQGKRPEIALQAASSWKRHVEESEGAGPSLLEPALAVARAHLALDREEEAYEALSATLDDLDSKLGRNSRTSLELLCAMGEEYARRGHLVVAESLFQQAVSRRSFYVPALLGLARLSRQAGSDTEAVERYEEVLRLEPENASARQELKSLLARGVR
jgi:tetratricopeptide (TPR) repeat protein